MLDDGVKAAGVEETEVKVADIAIHLLDAIESGERKLSHPNAPGPLGDGEVLEVDPPRRLVHTMVALWSDDVRSEGPSRVTGEIEPKLKEMLVVRLIIGLISYTQLEIQPWLARNF